MRALLIGIAGMILGAACGSVIAQDYPTAACSGAATQIKSDTGPDATRRKGSVPRNHNIKVSARRNSI